MYYKYLKYFELHEMPEYDKIFKLLVNCIKLDTIELHAEFA